MRIAICLSGQPRTWRYTYESLFNFFAGHDLDVFIHTWDEIGDFEREAVTAAYAPRRIVLGPRPMFLEEKQAMAARFPVSPPLTIFDMFHSMAMSLTLALESGGPDYDLICRTRFDTLYDGRWREEPPPKGAIAVQTGENELEGGCNDQFALGNPDAMRLYAGISAWLPKGMARLKPPNIRPEVALQTYLETVCGLGVHRERFALTLLREGRIDRRFSDLKDDTFHQLRKRDDWEAFAKAHMAPEIADRLDFGHEGRLPRILDKWLHAKPPELRRAALTGDWADRIVAIDGLLQGETGGIMDGDRYRMVRLIDAALINRMAPDEPMSPESFIVHAVSANLQDMQRALEWALEDRSRLSAIDPILDRLSTLGPAYRFAQPFQQDPTVGWPARDEAKASSEILNSPEPNYNPKLPLTLDRGATNFTAAKQSYD